ncbi:MAG: polysaccharide deacetylase family protein [Myxococcota bacterium]
MKTCVSIDMDNFQEYRRLIDPAGRQPERSFYDDALPRFLDLLERAGLRATFFMVGRDAAPAEHRDVVRRLVDAGHEVGNHSQSHPYNFAALSREQKLREIVAAEEAIAERTGTRPVGFRTPSCDVDEETIRILAERGYAYDASTFPSPLMLAFVLYGKLFVKHDDYQLGPMTTVLAPRVPYRPSADRFYRAWRPGQPPGPDLVEIPLSVTPLARLPFYATFLRMLGPGFFRRCVRGYGTERPVLHVAFHLMDLVDHAGTSLGAAVDRSPGLGVPFEKRERFVASALETLAGVGENATLAEVARDAPQRASAAA